MAPSEADFEMEPEPVPVPVTSITDLITCGYIADSKPDDPKIVDAEEINLSLILGDMVYINTGSDDGVKAGDRFYVLNNGGKIRHPETGKKVGYVITIPGILKVICVQDKISSAVIEKSYDRISRGQPVAPYYELEMPLTFGPPELSACDQGSREVKGVILDAYVGGGIIGAATLVKAGSIVYVDVGSEDGVVPGDYFSIWRENTNGGFRTNLGYLVLLRTELKTSSAYIEKSTLEIFLGETEIDLMK